MDKNNIKVSVIMPVYNSGEYLKTAVESILNQSLREIELILVDDGSTDGSSERCDEYAAKDSRVVVIHQKNGGICNARNAALKIARGEYIGFSDHDDEYLPGYIETAYSKAHNNAADIVKVGKKELIFQDGKYIRSKESCLPNKVFSHSDIKKHYFELIESDEMECVWDALFKKTLLNENDISFDEKLKTGGEDIVFIQELLPYVNTFVVIGEIYYIHYIRRGFSTSSKYNHLFVNSKERCFEAIYKTIKKLGINIEDHKLSYSYLLLCRYIAPLCEHYAKKDCPLVKKDKVQHIADLRKSKFYYSFCDQQSIRKMLLISRKYGFLYLLWKTKKYGTVIELYRLWLNYF